MQSGSPVYVYTSTHPLGPYTQRNILDPPSGASAASPYGVDAAVCSRAAPSPSNTCLGSGGTNSANAQQSDIFQYFDASGAPQYMWYGDRWQSAPDGIKGHDFTYWSPLAFAPDGNMTSFGWQDSFVVSVGL